MSPNRRIMLNIVATYGRSLYALVCGVVVGRWVVAALGKSEFGLCGVVGGMMMIDLLACTMRLDRGRFAAMMNVGRTYTVKHIQKGPMEVQRQRLATKRLWI